MKLIIQPLLIFYHKCHVHFSTIIYLLLALIAKYLKYYLMSMILVILHELSHFLIAYYFNYKICKIEILPFGAFLKIDDIYNHTLLEEACVIMAGPCSHVILFIIIKILPISIFKNFLLRMNELIFIFNLLPIYPLDGGRLMNILLQSLLDLKTALYFHLKLSILSLCILTIYYFQYQTIIIIIYLFYQQVIQYQCIPMYLRSAYLYTNHNSQKIVVHNDLQYRRGYVNYYLMNNQLYTQQQMVYILEENI